VSAVVAPWDDPNPSWSAKLARADQHLEIKSLVAGWQRGPGGWDVEVRAGRVPEEIEYVFRIHQLPDLTAIRAVAGDAIHNLRAALDHVAWALAVWSQPDGCRSPRAQRRDGGCRPRP
jgi:hypothetical protein